MFIYFICLLINNTNTCKIISGDYITPTMQANIDIISGCKIIKYEDNIWQFLDSAKEICFHTYNQELRHCCDRIESEIGSCKYKITNFFYKFKIILSMILLMILLAAGGGVAYFVLSQNEPIEEENAVKKSIISCLDLDRNETEDDTNCEKTNSCIQEILLRNITCYTNSTIYTDAEVDGVIMFVCSLYANYTYNLWPMICKKVYNVSRTESLAVYTLSENVSKSFSIIEAKTTSVSLAISSSISKVLFPNVTICLTDPCLGIDFGFNFNNKNGVKCVKSGHPNDGLYCGSDCLTKTSSEQKPYCKSNTEYINNITKEVVDYWKDGINLAGFLRYPSDLSYNRTLCDSWFALYMETADLKSYFISIGRLLFNEQYNNMDYGVCENKFCPMKLDGVCDIVIISYYGKNYHLHKDGIYFI